MRKRSLAFIAIGGVLTIGAIGASLEEEPAKTETVQAEPVQSKSPEPKPEPKQEKPEPKEPKPEPTPEEFLNMDDEACYDIAQYIQDGAPRETRVETVTDVGGYIGNADPRLQEAHEGLVRTMEGPESSFTLALDVYASVCLDDLKWDGEQ